MLFGFIEWIVKAARIFACGALVLIGGVFCARWSLAQTAGKPASQQKAAHSNVALDQLVGFVTHLENTGQTNTLRLFNDYSHAFLAQQHSADLGTTAWILLRLREGRTNEAIRVLEGRLKTDAVGFASSYRDLPGPLRQKLSLTSLGHARDYCKQYQVKTSNAEIAQIEAEAFALLDVKNPK
jgi:hypothetical protein